MRGRVLEAILKRSEAWRPAAAARNRGLGRSVETTVGYYGPAARSSRYSLRRKCRRGKQAYPDQKAPRRSAGRRAHPGWVRAAPCPARQLFAPFGALMSHVKLGSAPARPLHDSVEGYRCDDRTTVGAKPWDVGDPSLIRGFAHIRIFVRGFPCLRTGVDLAIGLRAPSGVPLP